MIIDVSLTPMNQPPALVRSVGFSGDAQYVDCFAKSGLRRFQDAYSRDDGRRGVQSELANQLEECSVPGWDGYGAEAININAYRYAYLFVESLPSGFPMPSVGAEADGHLTLEWYRNPSWVISVSISSQGDLHYAALLGMSIRRNGTELFLGEVPAELIQLIRRVMSA